MRFLTLLLMLLCFACNAERTWLHRDGGDSVSGSRSVTRYGSSGGSSGSRKIYGSGGSGEIAGSGGTGGTLLVEGSTTGGSIGSGDADVGSDVTVDTYVVCDDLDAGADSDAESTDGQCVTMSGFMVRYLMVSTGDSSEAYRITFNIVNLGDVDAPLQALSWRYYYTIDEGSRDQSYSCWFAEVDCGNVSAEFVESAGTDTDYYVEFCFTGGGTLNAGDETGQIQTGFNKSDWSRFDFSNDFSYQATGESFADAPRVTLYANEKLVWGVEPG
ncbi:MAG: hypothetical protein JXA30_14410 [Deltaproteobacteria bacterium]|nr:hypothetical protein [Deltaproteobacteria bacterium]